jgi:pimeloyl-ACP methyl ester carboxylesterase
MPQVNPAAAQPALVLLHGMFSGSADWQTCAVRLATHWRVIAPDLPVLGLPRDQTGVPSLVDHVERLLDREQIDRAVIAGNSLGGHVALSLALRHPGRVAALILAGSSGLSRRGFQTSVPRRPSREWVDRQIREVFFEDRHVTPRLVDEVFGTVTDARLAMKAVRMARSAKHENLGDDLDRVRCPVLLVWGSEDRVTPPSIACEFKQHIPHAELHFIPRCGHAPNIEQPEALGLLVEQFLKRNFSCAYADAPA